MATTGAKAGQRPLSPHLQVWRWGPNMAISILHRVTGVGLAIAGGIGLVWWLFAAATGPAYYAFFLSVASAWYGQIVLIGLSWAFFEHMLSGLRHFVLDAGAGYELGTNSFWSTVLPVLAVVLTAALWAAIYLGAF